MGRGAIGIRRCNKSQAGNEPLYRQPFRAYFDRGKLFQRINSSMLSIQVDEVVGDATGEFGSDTSHFGAVKAWARRQD